MANISLMNAIIIPNIDCTILGSSSLLITEPTERFIVHSIIFELTSISNISSVPSISIGSNQTFDNIVPITQLENLIIQNQTFLVDPIKLSPSIDPATNLMINISLPAISSNYVIQVTLVGFYYENTPPI